LSDNVINLSFFAYRKVQYANGNRQSIS